MAEQPRIGAEMRFDMDKSGYTTEHDLLAHDRQRCKVLRPTNEQDTEWERSGMYHVQFEDGFETDVYGDELSA